MNNSNFEITEPVKALRFDGLFKLYQHAKKHVCDTDEKWRVLPVFDSVQIRQATEENVPDEANECLKDLAFQYQTLVSGIVLDACAEQRDHLHFLEEYPSETVKLLGLDSSEPVRVIIAIDEAKKLVILAAEDVIKQPNEGYLLKTAYRTNLKSRKSWRKQIAFELRERNDMYKGKKVYLTADHLAENGNGKD